LDLEAQLGKKNMKAVHASWRHAHDQLSLWPYRMSSSQQRSTERKSNNAALVAASRLETRFIAFWPRIVNLIDLDMLGSVFLAVILQKLSGEK